MEANLNAPDNISDARFDKYAAKKCNYHSEQKYEVSRMFVAKPGWYHTIISPLSTTNPNGSDHNTNIEEALQNSTHANNASQSQANCDVNNSSNETTSNNVNMYSQLSIPSIGPNSSHIHGTVESHVTEISPDGKRVSINIVITL